MGGVAFEEARALVTRGGGSEEIGRGAGGDITTEFDRVLEEALMAHVPDGVHVLTEEAGAVGEGEDVIVLDPLDGSHNAGRGMPMFSVSIAHLRRPLALGNVEHAYVRHLVTGDEYAAVTGRGALRNGRPIRPRAGLHTIATEIRAAPPDVLIRAIAPLELATKVRCIGSVALDLAYVADGTVDAFLDLRGIGRTFDLAAGYLILREAGGVITDDAGAPLDDVPIDFDEHRNIVAAGTPEALERLLAAIADGPDATSPPSGPGVGEG